MFKRLYLKVALVIFISCALVIAVVSSFVYNRNRANMYSIIDRQLDNILKIDINTSASSLTKFSDSTVFLYFEGSDTPFTEQDLYTPFVYKKIYNAIVERNDHKGRVLVDGHYLAYKGIDVYYYEEGNRTLCREYVVYDYTTLRGYSDDLMNKIVIGGVMGIISFVALSLVLSFWFTKPLKEAHEREKRLLANASHELKTPVAIIMSDIDVLNNNRNKTVESQRTFIDSMSNQTERMRYLIQSILDYSKVGETAFEKKDFNLSSMVNELILILEPYAYDNKVLFETNIEPDIEYHGVEQEISALVSALLDNAIKYNRENGYVYVSLFKKSKKVVLEIKNNGEPISPENLDHIFDRFFKGDSSRNQGNKNSFGLGLSMAKAVVNAHKGKIKVDSKNDLTTFTVIL